MKLPDWTPIAYLGSLILEAYVSYNFFPANIWVLAGIIIFNYLLLMLFAWAVNTGRIKNY